MGAGLIAVTGANGFVGNAVVTALSARRYRTRSLLRRAVDERSVGIGSIGPDTDWRVALEGVDAVVHTAARVHVMHESATDSLSAFRAVNVEGTRKLAQDAALAGVRRLIFLSSVKVNGESTQNTAFKASDLPSPKDAYGLSKWEAEQILHEAGADTGLEVTIVRPPLIYGPGVKANFLALMRVLTRNIPLPLASIENRRSLVALDNLVDLVVTCIDHPAAANETFLVSDDEDLSTPELIRRMARAMNRSAHLFPMPPKLLLAAAALVGRREAARRLCESLQLDVGKTREWLGWKPPVSVDDGLLSAARWFLGNHEARPS